MAVGTSMLIAAGIGAAASVGSGYLKSKSASKAAKAQTDAAKAAEQGINKRFEKTEANLAPWRTTGAAAQEKYAGLLGVGGDTPDIAGMQEAMKSYPGYQFALDQGTEAVQKSAAGQGLLQSGQTMKDLTAYGQGLATNTFENYMNRLRGVSVGGQNAATQTGQFGAQAALASGQTKMAAGKAAATGYLNQGNVWGQAFEDVAGFAGYATGGSKSGYL